MNKPTIFFSHSSLDKGQLNRLKEAFCAKTGGAVEVFLSSDGQSIPLGRNWVYRVQEGLETASLMLVFITPNSINSSWVYFEAGYSYAKQVRVIPIGFLGVDLAQIGPPLSLLQGFNIASADTLNNLIALVNEQFSHKHSLSFLPEDYDNILGAGATTLTGPFGELLEHIEDIRLYLSVRDDGLKAEPKQLIHDINALLDSASIDHQSGDSFIRMRGVTISVAEGVSSTPLIVNADPAAIHATLPILVRIIGSIRNDGVQGIDFTFELTSGMEVVQKAHKITARLYDSEVQLLPEDGLLFRTLRFETGHYHSFAESKPRRGNAYVKVTPVSAEFNPEDAAALLRLLLETNVIYREGNVVTR